MKRFAMICTLSLTFLFFSTARAAVWEASNTWSEKEESDFAAWVRKLPMNFLNAGSGSKYGAISTDCADAAYTLRAIYAFEHDLPVAFNDDPTLSNDTTKFDSESDPVVRFKRFLRHLANQTNTRTLVKDTYPVAIDRAHLRAGVLYLNPEPSSAEIKANKIPMADRSGHVYYVQDVLENGMIRYFSSTVPAMVRDLQPRIDIVFAPFQTNGGFRAWKRPGVDDEEQPGFSLQQFHLAKWHANDFEDRDGLWERWQAEVRARLAKRDVTPKEEFEAKLFNVQGYIKERVNLVNMSWARYQKKYSGRGCMSAGDYDDYSTPSRDVKIQNELVDLKTAAQHYLSSDGMDTSEGLTNLFAQHKFAIGNGESVDLNEIWEAFMTNTVLAISEPEHSPAVRWGLEPLKNWPCPEHKKNYKDADKI